MIDFKLTDVGDLSLSSERELEFSQKDDKLLVNFTGFSYGQSLCVRVAQVKFR